MKKSYNDSLDKIFIIMGGLVLLLLNILFPASVPG